MLTEKQLLDLKEEIGEAKNKVAELKGQQNALMKQLKEEWGCTTLEQAEKKIAQIEEEVAILQRQIEKGIEELQEKYGIE